jgi:type I restriction enzyme R subunit
VEYKFITGQFTEAELEAAIIGLFQNQGYDYVLGETINRPFTDIILEDDLRAYLASHYPDLTEAEVKRNISYATVNLWNAL